MLNIKSLFVKVKVKAKQIIDIIKDVFNNRKTITENYIESIGDSWVKRVIAIIGVMFFLQGLFDGMLIVGLLAPFFTLGLVYMALWFFGWCVLFLVTYTAIPCIAETFKRIFKQTQVV